MSVCEYAYVCAGAGEKLTVCVRTVNYSVKVLGHEELIGIPKLMMLVMSEGGKQRCTPSHTGLSNSVCLVRICSGTIGIWWVALVYLLNYLV